MGCRLDCTLGGIMKLFALSAGAVLVMVVGCYEMKQDEKGRTVKLNKLTGELSIVDGDRIVKLRDENDIKAQQMVTTKLGEAMRWPSVSLAIGGGLNANLITKWSNGILYYQFFVDKNLRGRSDFAQLKIHLQDDAQFIIEQIPVNVSIMTGVVNEDGRTIGSMQYKGQLYMSEDVYRKIAGWTVSYSGFN